jgi:hypothetical protein
VVWSRSACAPSPAREQESPLDGENQNELNADAGRYREARIECANGYGVAEHCDPVFRQLRVLSTPPSEDLTFRDAFDTITAPLRHRARDSVTTGHRGCPWGWLSVGKRGVGVVFALAAGTRGVYHRFSMIGANAKVLPAAIAAFAIIAPPAR